MSDGSLPPSVVRNRSVFVPLLAALTAVSGFIAIPAGLAGVPIVLQNMFVILCGALLGPFLGVASVGLFLAAGAFGLPVFGGASGGIARFFGPTGGYLAGYLLSPLVAGLIFGFPRPGEKATAGRVFRAVCACFAGFAVQYGLGLLRLYFVIKTPALSPSSAFAATLAGGLFPFLPGDAIKLVVLTGLSLRLRPVIARFISGG